MLGVISRVAGVTLGAGDVRLAGTAPNGQRFMVAPRQIWAVSASRAVLRGEDLGPIGPLKEQARLGRLPPATAGHLRDRHGPFRELRRRPRISVQVTTVADRLTRCSCRPAQSADGVTTVRSDTSARAKPGRGVGGAVGGDRPRAWATRRAHAALGVDRDEDRRPAGLTRAQRDCTYYATLIMWIGCHADSHEYAQWFGDDIAVRHDSYLVDWSGLPYQRFLLSNIARGQTLVRRLSVMAALLSNARGHFARLIHSHCTSAGLLADRIGLSTDVQAALAFTFERYDGGGLPSGASGDAIPIEMRVAQLADMLEVHQRSYGVEGAVAMARSRSGGQFDPQLVDLVHRRRRCRFSPGRPPGDVWSAALREAPDRGTRLDEDALDSLLVALGDFVDLKCPFTLGHSRAVAALAADAATVAGLGCRQRRADPACRATCTTSAGSGSPTRSGPSPGR